MEKLYAQLPNVEDTNIIFTRVEPIIFGNKKYYGWKKQYFVYENLGKDENGKDKIVRIKDKNKPTEYDNLTQQLIDINVNKNSSANIIGELAQNKMLNANLINQLAQQKQVNLDQKNINAQLIAQLAKNGGNKNV